MSSQPSSPLLGIDGLREGEGPFPPSASMVFSFAVMVVINANRRLGDKRLDGASQW
jgi:hypothetical protein